MTFNLDVPGDVPSDQYFGEASLGAEARPFTVDVAGEGVQLSLALDKPFYVPGELATLYVTLTDTVGASNSYMLMSRYLSAEGYMTVSVPASSTVQVTFPFTATDPGRVDVFLSNVPSPQYGQRVLTLDSLPVQVIQPDHGAYLTHDKLIYAPGKTVHLTATITGTLNTVLVMGPMELAL